LGLATVFGIVSQHQGSIRVDSEIGKGTVFEIFLPVCEAEPEVKKNEPELFVDTKGQGDIWLVEDEPIVKEVTLQALQRQGYRVTAFDAPAACVAFMASQEHAPDLLITDVVMPGMNGKQLAAEIRNKWGDCNILFISGYAHDVISAQDLEVPGVSFLKKPFGTHDLFDEVRRFFEA
jgi:CheY-like chemotaxis protein